MNLMVGLKNIRPHQSSGYSKDGCTSCSCFSPSPRPGSALTTPAALSSAYSFSHTPRPSSPGGGTGPLGCFLDDLDTLLSSFPEDGTPLILLGDFNIHLETPPVAWAGDTLVTSSPCMKNLGVVMDNRLSLSMNIAAKALENIESRSTVVGAAGSCLDHWRRVGEGERYDVQLPAMMSITVSLH
ncbi:hypothetical protein AAFF_G00256210 [Aldrovandia affinis]|uniref:Endonuclease/exonuclease/phosphatase domain-containing protein n=1 Tax=Aldrovandia affinis TaxID=143900 RepID=A0AAD7W3G2_9TELE|nr:hypothetical protein AAFF_G00256210 [Aldrovandia affinis]